MWRTLKGIVIVLNSLPEGNSRTPSGRTVLEVGGDSLGSMGAYIFDAVAKSAVSNMKSV
jgi:hypothetical protein